MLSLPDLIALSAHYRLKTVVLSPMSLTVFYSCYQWLSNYSNWTGLSGGGLSVEEIDHVDRIVSKAFQEIFNTTMIGMIVPFTGLAMPDNFLPCNGGYYLKSDYPLLYDVINPLLKDGSGFNVPDLREKFIFGSSGSYPLLSTGGNMSVTLDVDNLPPHSHSNNPPVALNIDIEGAGIPDVTGAGLSAIPNETGVTGSGEPVSIMPPFLALEWGILAR